MLKVDFGTQIFSLTRSSSLRQPQKAKILNLGGSSFIQLAPTTSTTNGQDAYPPVCLLPPSFLTNAPQPIASPVASHHQREVMKCS